MVGTVLEADPPRRLVISWAPPQDKERAELHSRVTLEIEPVDDMARLTVTHAELEAGSDMGSATLRGLAACAVQSEVIARDRSPAEHLGQLTPAQPSRAHR